MRSLPAPWDPGDVMASFDAPVGAYLHIPFCEWICPFCPYNKVRARADLAAAYFEALQAEVSAYRESLPRDFRFTSLYVGGGTPTLYPEHLADVVAQIPVAGEVAIEVLPSHGTPGRLDRLRELGFTAVSIGAQSFHDEVLQRLHRPHDAAAARAAMAAAVGRFDCVDVDLIVDVELEYQGALRGAFLRDVRTCFEAGVDQVSTYPLMRFGYTPFGTAVHDRRREHRVLGVVTRLAERYGYERRSVWTFNRRGSAPYTSITRPRFLGMGAGATSFAGRDFYVNHFGVHAYIDAVARGDLPIARWLHLGRPGGAAYDAFWQAYSGRVNTGALRHTYGRWAEPLAAGLVAATGLGWCRRDGDGYALTRRGFNRYHDLERWVTYRFIEPLWAQMMTEHRSEDAGHWSRPERGRSGPVWAMTSRLLERTAPTGRCRT